MYTIEFKEKYDDDIIYLCEHENEIVKRLQWPVENAFIIWPKEPGNHRDYFIARVTNSLIATILDRRYYFAMVSDYTLYVEAVITHIDDNTDIPLKDTQDVIYTLNYVSYDDWRQDLEQKVAELLDAPIEEMEDHELALDILDNWMAKRRKSQRAEERGEKYLAR